MQSTKRLAHDGTSDALTRASAKWSIELSPRPNHAHVPRRQLIFAESALTVTGVDLFYGWNFCDRGERVFYMPQEEWQVADSFSISMREAAIPVGGKAMFR